MKNTSGSMWAFIVCAISIMGGCACPPSGKYTDQTVAAVDLNRYMGKWYAIASLPAWFQKNCHCVTAEYSRQEDHVKVVNSCRKGASNGPLKVSTPRLSWFRTLTIPSSKSSFSGLSRGITGSSHWMTTTGTPWSGTHAKSISGYSAEHPPWMKKPITC